MVKNSELPVVHIMKLETRERTDLMCRQVPRAYRNRFAYEVIWWGLQGANTGMMVPWLGVGFRYKDYAYTIDREKCWSTPLEEKPRRFRFRMVTWGTIPDDMLAFLAMMA